MMRILFAGQVGESLPPLYAGVPKRALMLAKIWKTYGAEVGICFTFRHDHEDDLGAGAQYFFEYRSRPTKKEKLLFLLRNMFRHPLLYVRMIRAAVRAFGGIRREHFLYAAYGLFIFDVIRAFHPTVIIAESGLSRSFFVLQVARLLHIPFVLETYAEVHDPTIMKFKNEIHRGAFWDLFLHACDLVIAPSEYCACGPRAYAPERVRMIYATTLDVACFTEDVRTKDEARIRFDLPKESFIVAAVGSFSPRKGHDHLIEAVSLLRARGFNVGAVLCGEGDPAWLRAFASEKGVGDAVSFFQNLSEDDLRLLFRSADMYCDASNTPRACLGIALTEALATGIPVIAYDVAGLPEVVQDGECGYLVALNDIKGLARAIERIYSMPVEVRLRLGVLGRKRARNVFDLNKIAPTLYQELEHVVENHEA